MSERMLLSEPEKRGPVGAGGIVDRISLRIYGCRRWKLFLHDDENVAPGCTVITAESEVTCKPRESGLVNKSEIDQ